VLGCEGIKGNETADQLAKLGSECALIGPEPACGISAEIAKKAVKQSPSKILGNPQQDSNRQRDSYKDPLSEEPRNC
jgi:hypothetical protein